MSDVRREVVIRNRRGLHARAAAAFVREAEGFEADILVCRNGIEAPGRSIMGLMLLAAAPGCAIEIRASGADAEAAVTALAGLVEGRFNEQE